jgi:hypothetical protein
LALGICFGVLGYYGYLIKEEHRKGYEVKKLDDAKAKNENEIVVITESPTERNDDTSGPADGRLARLEPPNGIILSGWHLDWTKEQPINITRKLGRPPAVS